MSLLGKLNGTRLRLALVGLLATVPVIGTQFLDARSVEEAMFAELRDTASEAGSDAVARVVQAVDEAQAFVRLIGMLPEVAIDKPASCAVTLSRLRLDRPWAKSFAIADPAGKVICTTDERAVGFDVSVRDYFREAVREHRVVVSGVFVSRLDGSASMAVAMPQFHPDGRLRQVVLAGLRLDFLVGQALRGTERDRATAALFDANRTPLAAYTGAGMPIPTAGFGTALGEAMRTNLPNRGSGTVHVVDEDGIHRIYGIADLPWDTGQLATGFSLEAATAATRDRIRYAFLLAFGAALTIVVLSWVAGEVFIVRPIRSVVKAAEALDAGDLDARVRLSFPSNQFAALAKAFNSMAGRLQKLVLVDSLTGVANRRDFDKVLERSWERARRQGLSIALGFVDVDKFKEYNDRFGHLAGDAALHRVGQIMKGFVRRADDLAARYGGEEFAVLLWGNTEAEAEAHCDALRKAVEEAALPHPDSPFGVLTVSIGVAALVPDGGRSPKDLVGIADLALYLAKRRGRNCVATTAGDVVPLKQRVA